MDTRALSCRVFPDKIESHILESMMELNSSSVCFFLHNKYVIDESKKSSVGVPLHLLHKSKYVQSKCIYSKSKLHIFTTYSFWMPNQIFSYNFLLNASKTKIEFSFAFLISSACVTYFNFCSKYQKFFNEDQRWLSILCWYACKYIDFINNFYSVRACCIFSLTCEIVNLGRPYSAWACVRR
jgi:hypothetical protein